jgi:hypothetical protein
LSLDGQCLLSRCRWRLAFVGAALALCLPAATAGAQQGERERLLSAQAESFPLSSELPTHAFAILGEGRLKERRWGAYVFRRGSRSGSSAPCIQIVSLRQLGRAISIFGGGPACGSPAFPSAAPIIQWVDYGAIGTKTIAVAVGGDVVSLTFGSSSGAEIRRRTKLLSAEQSRKAGVKQFRYVAFSIKGGVCFTSVAGVDRSGNELFEHELAGC